VTICRPTQNAEAVYRPLAAAYVPLSQTHVNTFVFIFQNSLIFSNNKQQIGQSEASRLDKPAIQSDRNSHWVTLLYGLVIRDCCFGPNLHFWILPSTRGKHMASGSCSTQSKRQTTRTCWLQIHP